MFRNLNPLKLIVYLIILVFIYLTLISLNSSIWLYYTIIIIFLGGIIILFIYLTRLTSNEKIILRIRKKNKKAILFIVIFRTLKINSLVNFNFNLLNLKILYLKFWRLNLVILVVCLLLTIFRRVKLLEKFRGSLKLKI